MPGTWKAVTALSMKSIEVIVRGEKGDLFTIHAGNDEIEDLETWLIQHYKKKPFNTAF